MFNPRSVINYCCNCNSTVAGNAVTTVSLLNGEDGRDKRQAVIRIFHSQLRFPSKVCLV